MGSNGVPGAGAERQRPDAPSQPRGGDRGLQDHPGRRRANRRRLDEPALPGPEADLDRPAAGGASAPGRWRTSRIWSPWRWARLEMTSTDWTVDTFRLPAWRRGRLDGWPRRWPGALRRPARTAAVGSRPTRVRPAAPPLDGPAALQRPVGNHLRVGDDVVDDELVVRLVEHAVVGVGVHHDQGAGRLGVHLQDGEVRAKGAERVDDLVDVTGPGAVLRRPSRPRPASITLRGNMSSKTTTLPAWQNFSVLMKSRSANSDRCIPSMKARSTGWPARWAKGCRRLKNSSLVVRTRCTSHRTSRVRL